MFAQGVVHKIKSTCPCTKSDEYWDWSMTTGPDKKEDIDTVDVKYVSPVCRLEKASFLRKRMSFQLSSWLSISSCGLVEFVPKILATENFVNQNFVQ